MTKKRALTLTVIFKALSGNYGENVGNISELKKLTHGGESYSFISRQALRHELWKFLKENYGIDTADYWEDSPELAQKVKTVLAEMGEGEELPPSEILHADNQVVQFLSEVNAINCVEADLFGYMKTESGSTASTRSAVVRFSPAVALEPMSFDVEFGTNKNFADRAGSDPNPFQFEHHYSLYSYTLTVDLDRLGAEFNRKGEKLGEVPVEEKLRRLEMVLEGIKFLRREIKGRIENLSPLFAVGGFYSVKNPFFLGRVEVSYNKETGKFRITPELIKEALNLSFRGEKVGNSTYLGYLRGFWLNNFEDEFNELTTGKPSEKQDEKRIGSIEEFFTNLVEKAEEVFKVGR